MFNAYKMPVTCAFLLSVWALRCCSLVANAEEPDNASVRGRSAQERMAEREFSTFLDGKWIGQGVCYGPYRENQAPGGAGPSLEQLSEDLHLISEHWNLLRLYSSSELAEDILRIIHREKLPLRVMLGAWIAVESESEGVPAAVAAAARQANQREVAACIRLANAYPREVIAVSVGNETQVFWSSHKVKPDKLIGYLKEVRGSTSVPVTTADDFNFWNKPESKRVAAEVDFIVTHIHPLWAGLLPSTAMQWTEGIYEEVCRHYPEKLVVIGEAGWATQVHDEGEQARLIKGEASEDQQRLYYQQFTKWAGEKQIATFFFEAFDEPWKGGPHPNEVEKHWGLFDVNRKPKAALSPIETGR